MNSNKLDQYDFVLYILDITANITTHNENHKEILDREQLQQLAYITSKKLDLDYGFSQNFYGPYSVIIRETLADLVGYYFAEERVIPFRQYNGYRYHLTDSGISIMKPKLEQDDTTYQQMTSIIKKCNDICNLYTPPMIYATKLHVEMMNDNTLDPYTTAQGFNFKQYTNDDIHTGIKLLKELDMMPHECINVTKS